MDEPLESKRDYDRTFFRSQDENSPYYPANTERKLEKAKAPFEFEEEIVDVADESEDAISVVFESPRGFEPDNDDKNDELGETAEGEETTVPDIEGEKLKILSMVSDLSSRLHLSLSVRDTIENELSKFKKELDREKAVSEEQKRIMEAQKKKIESLEYEYSKNKNSLKKTWETVEDLKIKMGIRDSELHSLNRTLKESVAREDEYRQKAGELDEEMTSARSILKKLQKENENLRSKLATAEQKAAIVDKLDTELSFALEDKSAIMEKVLILESQLQTAHTTRESLEKDLTEAKRALAEVSSALLSTHLPLPKKAEKRP